LQHCIVALELFIRTESITAAERGFQVQFQIHDVPTHNTVLWLVSKWQEGSVKDSKPQGCPGSVYTHVNEEKEKA
jgi:hypothetical protein